MIKKCRKCFKDKEDCEFQVNKKTGKPSCTCRQCFLLRAKEYSQAHRDRNNCKSTGYWANQNRPIAGPGQSICKHCKKAVDNSLFICAGRFKGCLNCEIDNYEANVREKMPGVHHDPRLFLDGMKLCSSCFREMPLTEFSAGTGYGKKTSACKECVRLRSVKWRVQDPEKVKASKRISYDKNKELATVNARFHAFKRSNLIPRNGDIDLESMKKLYSETKCYYCREDIPLKNRSVDHILPLSRGGQHSLSNMVMACRSCNSSKRDKTESEFMEYMKKVDMIKAGIRIGDIVSENVAEPLPAVVF